MHRISIHPDGLTAYATTTAVLAADLAAAAAHAATAAPELLVPAFGLIGADFLTAYAAAHGTHVTTLDEVSTILAAMSATTAAAAVAYTDHDSAYAATLGTAGAELSA
ncbi:type VII secretion target [Nocardia sp. NPDC101769]|uniref:type VII secretion target n=1 Tax=Nocardia sp. NPDC101769 TaxID=3364333 RepID=UPI00381825B3